MLLVVSLLTNLFTWWTKYTICEYIGTFLFIHVLHNTTHTQKKKKKKKDYSASASCPPVWVRPENHIHITSYISPSQAAGVKSSCMPDPPFFLFFSLKVLMLEATVNRLKLGCTLCPASLVVICHGQGHDQLKWL